MPTVICEACGQEISAENQEGLRAAGREHFNTVHAEWQVTETGVANWLDAKERLTGPTERLEEIGGVEVRQVTPDRVEEVLDFFDREAFADNPAWASCYCIFYHLDDLDEMSHRTWRQNRAEIEDRLKKGSTTGYLAYVDGKPAGWCNASARSAYPVRRKGERDDEVGVVACFVIAPPYRRHGVSRRLLDAALDGFRDRGIKRVEAHPVLNVEADAPNYHGPLSLYLGAGFTEVERYERTALVVKELD